MNNKIRSSQVLNTFSIGQIIPFPDNNSLMLGSLQLWDKLIERRQRENPGIVERADFKITDARRLQRLLNVSYFLKPIPNTKRVNLPGIRFPGWHYCSRCKVMDYKPITYENDDLVCNQNFINSPCCAKINEGYKKKLIPVRFIAACEAGHIQDVPFIEWVHNGNNCEKPRLQWQSGYGSGDLGSISIKCLSCNQTRSLAGITQVVIDPELNQISNSPLARIGMPEEGNYNAENNPNGIKCSGLRPWLGSNGINNPQDCKNHLRVLISGGSNVHFAKTKSSIYIPDVGLDLATFVANNMSEQLLNSLKVTYDQDMQNDFKTSLINQQIEAAFPNPTFPIDDIKKQIWSFLTNTEQENLEQITDTQIRFEEYEYYLSKRDNLYGDLVFETKNLAHYDDSKNFLNDCFDSVVLIKRLKETKAFYGFSRISAFDGKNIEESKQMLVEDGHQSEWLPAIQVYGEGIFIKFSDSKIEKWLEEQKPSTERIENSYHQSRLQRDVNYGNLLNPQKDISPVFIMLHTFAHLLIKRLCYNCGYGSSALREKIYFSSQPETKMNGILIYTSSGDSEGSLGGLVRQGTEKFLYQNVMDALNDASWCSADPVCTDIGGKSGQGPNNINGSACHNCCILPETSCEEFNGLLDRSVVVGTLSNPNSGFFNLKK